MLASARAVLAHIKTGRELQHVLDNEPVPAMNEDVEKLVDIGPGVLSSVFDDFKHNTIGAVDRLPLIAVIKRTGKPQDAPLLIHALSLIAEDMEEKEKQDKLEGFSLAFYTAFRSHETAINDCLAAITGQPNPTGTHRERLDTWLRWWDKNASTIVANGTKNTNTPAPPKLPQRTF